MKNMQNLALLLNVLMSVLSPASAGSNSVVNCLRFQQRSNVIEINNPIFSANYIGPMPHPILNRVAISAIVGAQEKDCEVAVNHVFQGIRSSSFAEKLFTVCVGTDDEYKITYDYKGQDPIHPGGPPVYGALMDDFHMVHVNRDAIDAGLRSHMTVVHETLHVLFRLIQTRLSTKKSPLTNMSEIIPGIANLLDDGKKMLDMFEGFSILEMEIPSKFAGQFKKAHEAAQSERSQFPGLFTFQIKPTDAVYKKILSKESLVLEDVMGGMKTRLKLKKMPIEVMRYHQGQNGALNVEFQCESPLLAAVYRVKLQLLAIEVAYDKNEIFEESVIAIFQGMPPSLIKLIYPGMLEKLEQYMDRLLTKNTPVPIYQPRGTDQSYMYPYATDLARANRNGLDILDKYSTIKLAYQVIKHRDSSNADMLIRRIGDILSSDHGLSEDHRLYMRLHMAELYYLTGDMVKASAHYKYIEKTDKTVLYTTSQFGSDPYEHYVEAAKAPDATPMFSSTKRAGRSFE
ncbi:MAG: hypothetical protein ACHQAX_07235 [Gammaproteobacteria bacterium]